MKAPKPPKFLGAVGRSKWRELSKQLGELKPADVDMLALLCCSWEDFLHARGSVNEFGHYLTSDKNGRTFINPSVNERNEAWKQIVKLSKTFGLHPAPRVDDAGSDDEGEWDGLIEK